jgi:hypothetical protein
LNTEIIRNSEPPATADILTGTLKREGNTEYSGIEVKRVTLGVSALQTSKTIDSSALAPSVRIFNHSAGRILMGSDTAATDTTGLVPATQVPDMVNATIPQSYYFAETSGTIYDRPYPGIPVRVPYLRAKGDQLSTQITIPIGDHSVAIPWIEYDITYTKSNRIKDE